MKKSEKEKYLVTAALPYANGYLHIGHIAGAYLPSDIYVRYKRLIGDDVIFICGSDEYGTAIEMSAIKENVTPKEIIDRYHFSNKQAFEDLSIKFDIYSRTSNDIHTKTAQDFFLNLYNKGILTQKKEKQLYSEKEKRFLADRFVEGTCPKCGNEEARGDQCEDCGSNLSPLELINPRSKISGDTPVVKESTHYYIPLDKLQPEIEQWIKTKKNWKANVINYCNGWFKTGLKSRAITRDLDWGVKVPLENNEGKVIYVWFEAPIGYISATKELFIEKGNPDGWKDYWCSENSKLIHFIGKDNIIFHAIVFPAMLKVYGDFVLPDNVPANEFLNQEGNKLSKSKGHGVLVKDIVKDFPPDVVRYTLTSILPENKDSDFHWTDLQSKNNSELAGILGNFINRTVVFAKNKFDNKIPQRYETEKVDDEILNFIKSQKKVISDCYEKFRFKDALNETMNVARAANKYFNDCEPWNLIKSNPQRCETVINNCLQICHSLAILISPVLPTSADRILKILNKDKKDFVWNNAGEICLNHNDELGESEILFPQIDDKQIQAQINSTGMEEIQGDNLITIDDFSKVHLKVAKVIKCENVEKSKKLLKLQIKVGENEKQIVAGIAEYYKPEDLLGKLIVIVDNLKPTKLMGIKSEGMLLAAKKDKDLTLITVDKEINSGSLIN
ncbi:MAG: methionine--tRNA ligase [Ignavibacteria bacterium]|nr:methionine--tRNA ligase [Ignavibacteria bacterium]